MKKRGKGNDGGSVGSIKLNSRIPAGADTPNAVLVIGNGHQKEEDFILFWPRQRHSHSCCSSGIMAPLPSVNLGASRCVMT